MNDSRFVLEEITDPVQVARGRAQDERARRNSAWLQAHWAEILPTARGRFLAVAGQKAFVADTPAEAWGTGPGGSPLG